jgi:catechol 2,3-dioxygenase-like lactoylglutathione lyase family enzyme
MSGTFKTAGRSAPDAEATTVRPRVKEFGMSTPQLDLIGIVVDDMARSLAFYRRLGLDLPADADSQPHVDLALPGGMRLAWDTLETIRSFDPDYQPPTGSRIGLAFRLDNPDEVDATYKRLVAAGYHGHKEPWDAFWGQRYAVIHDPDGNGVDLFAVLPPAGAPR